MPSPPMKRGSKHAAPGLLQFGLRSACKTILENLYKKHIHNRETRIRTSADSLAGWRSTINKATLKPRSRWFGIGALLRAGDYLAEAFATGDPTPNKSKTERIAMDCLVKNTILVRMCLQMLRSCDLELMKHFGCLLLVIYRVGKMEIA